MGGSPRLPAGATTLGSLLKQSVTVETYYCTSPAAQLLLPDGSKPWGGSTSSNVAMHTGTHVYESRNIDDIFLSARRAGIKSVFAGGSPNYVTFEPQGNNARSLLASTFSAFAAAGPRDVTTPPIVTLGSGFWPMSRAAAVYFCLVAAGRQALGSGLHHRERSLRSESASWARA